MRKRWVLAGVAVVAAAVVTSGVFVFSEGGQATPSVEEVLPATVTVEKGKLSSMVSIYGTLAYRARSDGTPYSVVNQANGIYTELPDDGDKVDCGEVLYTVDDNPVVLLCGSIPAYRSLSQGDSGPDVAQLNANLVDLGYASGPELDPSSEEFSFETASALAEMQSELGEDQTMSLDFGQVVFLPESVRIGEVTSKLGEGAQPGAPVLNATSETLEVQLALDPSQRDVVKAGDPVQITLPGNTSVMGKVDRIGKVAVVPESQNGNPVAATIPAYITLDDPEKARGFDHAPVQVNITTKGVEDVLNVPVTALVGKSGGGFAVQVIRGDGRRELVAVTPGLFDTAGGRVQIDGNLHEGDQVVVPSS